MKRPLGQRIAIAVLAFALRRHPDSAPRLRAALDRAYAHRPEGVRIEMWRAALERNGVRVG